MTAAPDSSLPPDVLQALVEGAAARIGEAFFDGLVEQLSRALGTKGVWVTEWLPDDRRLRALAFWYDGAPFGDYEYAIAGTPCEPVVETCDLFRVEDRLIELFPDDPDLAPMNAVSYMGIPLVDADGELLGHLAVLDDEPMPERPQLEAVFRLFAERAAAELGRLRRERDVREREARWSALVGSALDAILELETDDDGGLTLARMNAAAEKVFGCDTTGAAPPALASLLAPGLHEQLARLATELGSRSSGDRSLWIAGGLEARRVDGSSFPAEATLSGFELNGEPHYTLILRNVDDRLAAEQRIRELTSEADSLRAEIDALQGPGEILGRSAPMRAMLDDIERVAGTGTTVLITGETGTGKELVARAIHERSARAEGPLIKVNCAAISPNLQESEFFGHAKGAFTGATQAREGRFQLADGGTIFLDEVGEMPLDLQAKLLRVLQEGELEPVGDTTTRKVDVRLIAATNRDLAVMVEEGTFRRDLLYRLNVFPVHAPALRERGDDIVLLAEAFAGRLAERMGRTCAPLSEDGKARLRRYEWPGNVRELENVVERALITSVDGGLNLARALPDSNGSGGSSVVAPAVPTGDDERILTVTEMRDFERANLVRALTVAGWKVSGSDGAAALLGLNPNTLSSRMRALDIERPAGS